MNTQKMAMEYRIKSWREAMAERVAGKESIKAFCTRKGVSRNAYFYWQRKIRARLVEEMAGTATDRMPVPAGWREVEEVETKQGEDSGVTIEIGKIRIQATESTPTELLRKVCKALVEIC